MIIGFEGGFMDGQTRKFRCRVTRFERAVDVRWIDPETMVVIVEVYVETKDCILSLAGRREQNVKYHLTWDEAAKISGKKWERGEYGDRSV